MDPAGEGTRLSTGIGEFDPRHARYRCRLAAKAPVWEAGNRGFEFRALTSFIARVLKNQRSAS
jgi:hypothetical protein